MNKCRKVIIYHSHSSVEKPNLVAIVNCVGSGFTFGLSERHISNICDGFAFARMTRVHCAMEAAIRATTPFRNILVAFSIYCKHCMSFLLQNIIMLSSSAVCYTGLLTEQYNS